MMSKIETEDQRKELSETRRPTTLPSRAHESGQSHAVKSAAGTPDTAGALLVSEPLGRGLYLLSLQSCKQLLVILKMHAPFVQRGVGDREAAGFYDSDTNTSVTKRA